MARASLIIPSRVGAITGRPTGELVKGFGPLGNVDVGIVGAFIASYVLPQTGLHIGSRMVGAIIHATLGAAILLVLLKRVRRA